MRMIMGTMIIMEMRKRRNRKRTNGSKTSSVSLVWSHDNSLVYLLPGFVNFSIPEQ